MLLSVTGTVGLHSEFYRDGSVPIINISATNCKHSIFHLNLWLLERGNIALQGEYFWISWKRKHSSSAMVLYFGLKQILFGRKLPSKFVLLCTASTKVTNIVKLNGIE